MTVTTTSKDGVFTIVLDRPEARNAMTGEMWVMLLDALETAQRDESIGCVVLTGAEGAFCAGGDVKGFAERLSGQSKAKLEDDIGRIQHIVRTSKLLHTMPKVTIAAINGAAAGAGLSLALACDLRIMADDAKLTTAFANIALSGDFGGAYFLSKIVGQAKARELFFLSPTLTGAEAAAAGVVNRSVPRDAFTTTVAAAAGHIANGPKSTLAAMKANFNLAETASLDDYLMVEAERMARSFYTSDHREAAMAFVEKRKPNFSGQ
ncbi:MAG: enoyl-CoA hydratase-related protein [Ahrensia sp.]|nr:enoyl-CoA hydratase-related protein [Ahrensia sp.]